jgi:hypothetical protein
MKLFLSLAAVVIGTVGVALASPVDARRPLVVRQALPGANIAGIGQCPVSFPQPLSLYIC